jgi:hypothetical protein
MQRIEREGIVGIREIDSFKRADVEYRVVWNKAENVWSVFRNGVATGISARKKKKSAVDSAIRDAKAELGASEAYIVVVCIEGRNIETVWRGPSQVV